MKVELELVTDEDGNERWQLSHGGQSDRYNDVDDALDKLNTIARDHRGISVRKEWEGWYLDKHKVRGWVIRGVPSPGGGENQHMVARLGMDPSQGLTRTQAALMASSPDLFFGADELCRYFTGDVKTGEGTKRILREAKNRFARARGMLGFKPPILSIDGY